MAKLTIEVTTAQVAIRREGVEGYDVQEPYTVGKFKLRAFQKLVNHYFKDTKVLSTTTKTITIYIGDITNTLQSYIEQYFKDNNIEISCYLEPITDDSESEN